MKIQILKITSLALVVGLISCSKNSDTELMAYSDGNDWGYINSAGEIVINPQFNTASNFAEGYALVSNSEGRFGYIDPKGNYLGGAPSYSDASYFSEDKAWVVKPLGAPTCISKDGSILFTCETCETVSIFKEGLALFSQRNNEGEQLFGYLNDEGMVEINAQFISAGDFSNGLAYVLDKNGKIGFINAKGDLKINYQFKNVLGFNENKMASVYDGKKWGWIDSEGKYVCNPQFQGGAVYLTDDFWAVSDGENVGFTTNDGEYIVNPQFDDVGADMLNADLALIPFRDGKSWGYIDQEGKIVINPQFDKAFQFVNGNAVVKSSNGFGIINKEGKYQVNPQFEQLLSPSTLSGLGSKTVNSQFVDISSLSNDLKWIFDLVDGTSTIDVLLSRTESNPEEFVNSYYPQFQYLFNGTKPLSKTGLDLGYFQVWNGDLRETKEVKETNGWYTYSTSKSVLLKGKIPSLWQFGIYTSGNLDGLFNEVFEIAIIEELKRRLQKYEFTEEENEEDARSTNFTFKGNTHSIIITVGTGGAYFKKVNANEEVGEDVVEMNDSVAQ